MSNREAFTALDWIAVGLALLAAIIAATIPIGVGPSFARMYADFGAPDALPALTRFVVSPAAAVLALPPSMLVGASFRVKSIGVRRAMIVVAFFVAAAAIAVCLVGAYLPLWQVASAVRAE